MPSCLHMFLLVVLILDYIFILWDILAVRSHHPTPHLRAPPLHTPPHHWLTTYQLPRTHLMETTFHMSPELTHLQLKENIMNGLDVKTLGSTCKAYKNGRRILTRTALLLHSTTSQLNIQTIMRRAHTKSKNFYWNKHYRQAWLQHTHQKFSAIPTNGPNTWHHGLKSNARRRARSTDHWKGG